MVVVPEVKPVMIPDMDAKFGIVVEDRLRFGVDGAACREDRQMVACNVVHVLCLVQASFDGIHVELVAWEHLPVKSKV
jgi:hypothetical protein